MEVGQWVPISDTPVPSSGGNAPLVTASQLAAVDSESAAEAPVRLYLPDDDHSDVDHDEWVAAEETSELDFKHLNTGEQWAGNHLSAGDEPVCISADEGLMLPSRCDYQSRFRVVKIDTTEPALQRGRWVCLNFQDTSAASLCLGRAADWLHDDVGYSSGSSVSSSGPGGGAPNPLVCFVCDGDLPHGVERTETIHSSLRVLSSSDLFPERASSFSHEMSWLDSGSECVSGFPYLNSPLRHNQQVLEGEANTEGEDTSGT